MEDKLTEATQVEALKKMRDAMTFETAWTYETMKASTKQKEQVLDCVRVIWNRSLSRAGYPTFLMKLCMTEEAVKKVLEIWSSDTVPVLESLVPKKNSKE